MADLEKPAVNPNLLQSKAIEAMGVSLQPYADTCHRLARFIEYS